MGKSKILLCFLLTQVGFAQIKSIDSTATEHNLKITSVDSIRNKQLYNSIDSHFVYQYEKPRFFQMFQYIPDDLYKFGLFTIQKENLKWDALTVGSTLAILPFDQKLTDNAGEIGHKIGGWDLDSQYGKVFGLFSIVPKNISSAVYYIGNGGTTLLLSGAFYGIGKFCHNDYRALNTSNELVEALFSVGILDQSIKRITGRQSPNRAIADGTSGGEWVPFPSFNSYQKQTPNYDAMPSGHLATYMATLTIITVNYPELKWIKPVGYAVGGVLAFNMVSSKVHWVSDYPLGILMGYVIGKNIADRRIKKIAKNNVGVNEVKKYKINYSMNQMNGYNVVGALITF